MKFAERLKNLRKQAGFSQEKLAEKLGVSRQAITKWENDAGTPDIENMMAISALFGISLDELLSGEKPKATTEEYLFESVTEYDIDRPKRYDLKLGGAKRVCLAGYDGEKIRIRLASNQLSSLQSDLKAKLDDVRDRIDLDLSRKNNLTEAVVKDTLFVSILLPKKYIRHIELTVNAESIELSDMECEQIELDVKTQKMLLDGIVGTVEVNCNLDMDIVCRTLQGSVELNQISATSRITLPQECPFCTLIKGMGNRVSYEKDGNVCENFSDENAENTVKLNGMKSELVIARTHLRNSESIAKCQTD